jgi:hypothetical protein
MVKLGREQPHLAQDAAKWEISVTIWEVPLTLPEHQLLFLSLRQDFSEYSGKLFLDWP